MMRTFLKLLISAICLEESTVVADLKPEFSGELYIPDEKGACGLVIPMVFETSKIAMQSDKTVFISKLHKSLSNGNGSICIEPTDMQEADPQSV